MVKIIGWKCDICRKEFREGDVGFSTNTSLYIKILFTPFDATSEYKFEDTCLNCRTTLDCSIQKTIVNATIVENNA